MKYTEEILSDEFTKHHIGFEGLPLVVHHFTGIDKGGPHDHPAPIRTFILKGSYIERRYYILQNGLWGSELIEHPEGDTFLILPNTIHEVVDLPEGECWTTSVGKPAEREWRFWRFENGEIHSRVHDSDEWIKYNS